MKLWRTLLDEGSYILIAFSMIGAFIAAPIALVLAYFLSQNRPLSAHFSSVIVLLGSGTLSIIFLQSGLNNALHFTEHLTSLLSLAGLKDFIRILIPHGYSFVSSGLRLYLPLCPIALVLISLIVTIKQRHLAVKSG